MSGHKDETIIETGSLEKLRSTLEAELHGATPRGMKLEQAARLIERMLHELPVLLVVDPEVARTRAEERRYQLRRSDLFLMVEFLSMAPKVLSTYATMSAGEASAGKVATLWIECRRADIPLSPAEACVLQAVEETGFQGCSTAELQRRFPELDVLPLLERLRTKTREGTPMPLIKTGQHRHWAAAL